MLRPSDQFSSFVTNKPEETSRPAIGNCYAVCAIAYGAAFLAVLAFVIGNQSVGGWATSATQAEIASTTTAQSSAAASRTANDLRADR